MEWQRIIFSVVGIILTTLVTWGVERLTTLLSTKIKNEKALRYSLDAVDIVTNAVKSTYQTYVQALKDKNLFDKKAQKNALTIASTTAQRQMSDDVKDYIQNNFGDITNWVTTQIESSLYDLKK